MNVPDERIETDWAEAGCSKRSCRYEHSYRWGLCAHAEEPPPDTRCFRWKTFTASDGYLSVGTEEVDHTELRAEIERQVRAKVAEEILSPVEIDIRKERQWQAKRFPLDHPDGTGWDAPLKAPSVYQMRAECRGAFGRGEGTWLHVLAEEVGEASDADKPHELRAELIQVAAVAQAWVEAIDRRGEHDGDITRGES